MSKSRLEKFLYALYSLDSSDLPNPLSRIEELYKCWVTGEEVSTFKPLSRVEKYLMAILGVYDVDSLPNPLSRVEVLLYKLATGDDNLDDVKSFLSEHEELLAEIIRNGGAGGNINIEYVLYILSTEHNTLYNTAEKPVKSAILKGDTLVNLSSYKNLECTQNRQFSLTKPDLIRGNKTYIFIFTHTGADGDRFVFQQYEGEKGWINNHQVALVSNTPKQYYIFTTTENTGLMKVQNTTQNTYTLDNLMVLEYQNGMENWDIPYFEGMKSVQMPVLTTTNCLNLFTKDNTVDDGGQDVFGDFVEAKKNDKFSFNEKYGYGTWTSLAIYNVNKERIYYKYEDSSLIPKTIVLPDDDRIAYVRPRVANNKIDTIMFNRGEVIPYEEYKANKSNILTVNEEVELRGIGDVKDELNLLTGEVVQSIYNLQLTGDDGWGQSGFTNDDYFVAYTAFTNNLSITASKVICDKLNYDSSICVTDTKTEGINIIGDCSLRISLSKTKVATLNDFINWIRQEQPVINFVAKEKPIKTVDLSVVDQDGNDTKLSTFNDITHVTLSSEGLIPEAELEVATKNEEVLSTLSLEMDDIFATQNTLEETANTQSENVDATMIATTEIYEGLL